MCDLHNVGELSHIEFAFHKVSVFVFAATYFADRSNSGLRSIEL